MHVDGAKCFRSGRPGIWGMLLALQALVGCDDRAAMPPAPAAPAAGSRGAIEGDVWVDLDVEELPGHQVRLSGATNLPAGTVLGLDVGSLAPGGFWGESERTVGPDGSFEAGPFGPESGLPPGDYLADVTMPIPRVQPDHVRAVIGEAGENLTGPLVKRGDHGVTVSTSEGFTIGVAAPRRP